MLVLLMLAMAAPSPRSLDTPRKAYSTCIRDFENKSLAAKMSASAYSTALKTACTSEAASLARALTDYDVAMGGKRATAALTAESDVADYRQSSEERFRDEAAPDKGN